MGLEARSGPGEEAVDAPFDRAGGKTAGQRRIHQWLGSSPALRSTGRLRFDGLKVTTR